MAQKKKMNKQLTRKGKLLGGYVPYPVVTAVQSWVSQNPERDVSTFIREAAREKLRREGITFNETEVPV
jgi:hypothetical protein